MSGSSKAFSLILAGIFAFILLLGGTELVERLWIDHDPRQLELWPRRTPRPYVMFGDIRDPRWPPQSDTPDYRIVMIGGSTVAEGKPPLPSLLENNFRRHGFKRVKVFNLGIVSQKSSQELAQLVFNVVDGKPDLVIMYDGGNDIMDPMIADPRPGFPMDFVMYENNPLLLDSKSYPVLSLIAFKSIWIRTHFKAALTERLLHLKELRGQIGYGSEVWRQEIADTYVKNILKSTTIAHAFNVPLVVIFQPLLFFKTPVGPQEAKMINPAWSKHALDTRRRIFQLVGQPRTRERLRFIDLSEIFMGIQEDVFTDYIHVNQKYQQLLSDRIYTVLDVKKTMGKPFAGNSSASRF